MKGQRRKFSDDFKIKVVQEANEGQISLAQLALKFDLTPNQIKVWRRNIEALVKMKRKNKPDLITADQKN